MAEGSDQEMWIVGEREVPPDPSLARYIGAHHSLQSAVADIVDNSISAGAQNIRIRFLLHDYRATSLQIIDDGTGMSAAELDDAMVMGRGRDYGATELGHFGVGLKAASLSQATEFALHTRKGGATPAGRSMRHSDVRGGNPRVSEYRTDSVHARLDALPVDFSLHQGTVVEWFDVRTFPQDPDPDAQKSWLDAITRTLATSLGARHHRIIGAGGPRISIDVLDKDVGETGMNVLVESLDPFAYSPLRDSGYPKTFRGSLPGAPFTFTAHVVPYVDRTSPNYLLSLTGEDQRQGFFIYRRDRLLQVGGWNGVLVPSEDLRFARIEIDIDAFEDHAMINPEKSGVEFDATLRTAVLAARTDDGNRFRDFQKAARNEDTAARSRRRRPLDFTPATGIPSEVRRNLEERGHLREDTEDFKVQWGRIAGRHFFDVNREKRELTINNRFHELLTGRGMADGKTGPLTRTMMYLLTADLFSGQYIGAAQQLRMEAMQEALWLAAEDEEQGRRATRRRR